MENQPYLSVIIPAYNEGARKGEEFKHNFEEIRDYLAKKGFEYEVIVVNDGSKDNTAEFANSIGHIVNNFKLIDRKENRGKWYTVREGFLAAKGKFRLLTDADGATSITNLEDFWTHMTAGEHIIIGSRDLKESKIKKHQPKWKEFLGDAGNLLIQFLMGLQGIKDTQCGFKVLSAEATEKIITQMRVDRWGGDFEMLMLGKRMGYKIIEIPVVWIDAGLSLVGISGYINTFRDLFFVKLGMITGKYNYKK